MKITADFSYRRNGLFVRIFPETPEAVGVWNTEIATKTGGTGNVLAIEFPQIRAALISAGYTIRKM